MQVRAGRGCALPFTLRYGVIGSTSDFGSLSEDSDSSGPAKNSKMRCSIMVITSDSGPDNSGSTPLAPTKGTLTDMVYVLD